MATAKTSGKDTLARQILSGDPSAIGRAITLLEEQTADGRRVLEALYPRVGKARRVGITGPPGVGKSTLIAALVGEMRLEGKTVGVIAVDPTSPRSGGALLGDRIRLAGHFTDRGVFIRSMATRGRYGGISTATFEASDLLDAAGKDFLLVETIGVGQNDVEVSLAVDTTVVVLSAESGDGIQIMKSGLLEEAEILVVNKADRPGADLLASQLAQAFSSSKTDPPSWPVSILVTNALEKKGLRELLEALRNHRRFLEENGLLAPRRREKLIERIRRLAMERLAARWRFRKNGESWLARRVEEIQSGRGTPHEVVEAFLRRMHGSKRA